MLVPACLRDRVAALDVVVADPRAPAAPVLPGPAVVLGVQLRGRLVGPDGMLAPAGVTGLHERARTYSPVGTTTSILVRFTPTGAASLGVPASDIAGRSVPLDDVRPPREVRELVGRVADAGARGDLAAAQRALVTFLARLPLARDPLVEAALAMFAVDDAPAVAVADVARALRVSARTLQRRFLERVGVTPKAWSGLTRFDRAVRAARSSSLTTAALAAGYYDQAHFNRDVRRRTGAAPGRALR